MHDPFADPQKEVRTLGDGLEQSERRGEGIDHRGCCAHGLHDADHHVRGRHRRRQRIRLRPQSVDICGAAVPPAPVRGDRICVRVQSLLLRHISGEHACPSGYGREDEEDPAFVLLQEGSHRSERESDGRRDDAGIDALSLGADPHRLAHIHSRNRYDDSGLVSDHRSRHSVAYTDSLRHSSDVRQDTEEVQWYQVRTDGDSHRDDTGIS